MPEKCHKEKCYSSVAKEVGKGKEGSSLFFNSKEGTGRAVLFGQRKKTLCNNDKAETRTLWTCMGSSKDGQARGWTLWNLQTATCTFG